LPVPLRAVMRESPELSERKALRSIMEVSFRNGEWRGTRPASPTAFDGVAPSSGDTFSTSEPITAAEIILLL
jgi:hypothetical protein